MAWMDDERLPADWRRRTFYHVTIEDSSPISAFRRRYEKTSKDSLLRKYAAQSAMNIDSECFISTPERYPPELLLDLVVLYARKFNDHHKIEMKDFTSQSFRTDRSELYG